MTRDEAKLPEGVAAVTRIMRSNAREPMREAALLYLEGLSTRRAAAAAGVEFKNLWRFAQLHRLQSLHERRQREHCEDLQALRRFERVHQKAAAHRQSFGDLASCT